MNKSTLIEIISQEFNIILPDAKCSLNFNKPHELLIAGRLSAQCTDARVNIVTKELFKKYPNIESFATADVSTIENYIHSCGLYKTKARSIVTMCQQIIENFNGIVPSTIEELITLSGIGRKTANLIIGDIYGGSAIVTDTHCIRISRRLNLTAEEEPKKVEKDLRILLTNIDSTKFCHQMVSFGRDYCRARKPLCDICPIRLKLIEFTGKDYICKL